MVVTVRLPLVVAVKVTGLPPMPLPAAVAVSVFVSAVGPSVQEVTAAIPLAFVVTGVVGLTVPPPEVTANVTATPATGLPAPSRMITAGGEATAVPAGAHWLVGPLAAIATGVGCETVTLAGAERPALAAVTVAVPRVVPALNVVAVVPAVLVCPLVGFKGCVASETPVAGVVATVQATVAPASGAPCRSATEPVITSAFPTATLAVRALRARLPGIPVSIRKWIGNVPPSFSTIRSPLAKLRACPGVVVSNTSAKPSSRRAPLAPAVTCTR